MEQSSSIGENFLGPRKLLILAVPFDATGEGWGLYRTARGTQCRLPGPCYPQTERACFSLELFFVCFIVTFSMCQHQGS